MTTTSIQTQIAQRYGAFPRREECTEVTRRALACKLIRRTPTGNGHTALDLVASDARCVNALAAAERYTEDEIEAAALRAAAR